MAHMRSAIGCNPFSYYVYYDLYNILLREPTLVVQMAATSSFVL